MPGWASPASTGVPGCPCALRPTCVPMLAAVPVAVAALAFASDMQAAGVVLAGCPAALTGPLDRSQAPGWPGMPLARSV